MSGRLPPVTGEWIDRSRPLRFLFEGGDYQGFAGDTVSSALHASGVLAMGRSFKYHRLRGILSLANHDVNVLMQWGDRLNLRADVSALASGMDLRAVNTVGGLAGDRRAVMDRLSRFLPVGFYYKAFHTPKARFARWERTIREAAGLGEVRYDSVRTATPKRYAFTDIAVVGAGPTGLAAALTAAAAGAKVALIDENAHAGGSLTFQKGMDRYVDDVRQDLLSRLAREAGIEVMLGTEAAAYYADHWLALVDADKMTKLRARAVVIATGAYEQPAVFRNNDLPGVMLGSAAQRLIYRYAVRPAERALVLTANDEGYLAALDLRAHGVDVAAVIDLRREGDALRLAERASGYGIAVRRGYGVVEAIPAPRGDRVGAAVVAPLNRAGELVLAGCETIACDAIAMSVGYAPALNLAYQAGAGVRYDASLEQFLPNMLPPGVFAAGRVNGIYTLANKLRDGERAGADAARYLGFGAPLGPFSVPREAGTPNHSYPIFPHPKGKNFVDFDEDLQLRDFFDAAQEGFDNIELLKRYTTVGMGPSQGKHSNMNAIRVLARLCGKPIGEIGTTTARPFVHPVPLSHLAGRGFHPERLTALHSRHEKSGAKFMQAGVWLRPEYYRRPGESKDACVLAEARAVRNAVGLIDVGTLGKLEVYGPDAAQFLERVYTGRFGNMKVGTTRYCLMCDESGVVIDDGVVARLAEQHFYFTTTTTGSATVYRELARLNTMWWLDLGIVNLTGHFAALNLAGPNSRAVLARLTSLDLSEAAFPYLGVREGEVGGIPARLLRVGFVGELGYEIHVPTSYAASLWDALMREGERDGIAAFGVEAQRLLRLEKAHMIVGQDTDGLTHPFEAAAGFAVKMDKPFFIGQRSLKIIRQKPARQILVGFSMTTGHKQAVPKECHLVIREQRIAGRVTSVATSETLGQVIGLAYVEPDQGEIGTRFTIRVDGGDLVEATVVKTPFYDADGQRQRTLHATPAPRSATAVETRAVRASPLADELASLAPTWGRYNDMPVARAIGDVAQEQARLQRVALADLSCLSRFGLKGAAAQRWLSDAGIAAPPQINQWQPLGSCGLIARLGTSEFLIEDGSAADRNAHALRARLGGGLAGVTPVAREDAEIVLAGPEANRVLSQTCSFDFRSLDHAERSLVMTSMIGVSVLVIASRWQDRPLFQLWCDPTFAPYLWRELVAIAQELGGGPVGLGCLFPNLDLGV